MEDIKSGQKQELVIARKSSPKQINNIVKDNRKTNACHICKTLFFCFYVMKLHWGNIHLITTVEMHAGRRGLKGVHFRRKLFKWFPFFIYTVINRLRMFSSICFTLTAFYDKYYINTNIMKWLQPAKHLFEVSDPLCWEHHKCKL